MEAEGKGGLPPFIFSLSRKLSSRPIKKFITVISRCTLFYFYPLSQGPFLLCFFLLSTLNEEKETNSTYVDHLLFLGRGALR